MPENNEKDKDNWSLLVIPLAIVSAVILIAFFSVGWWFGGDPERANHLQFLITFVIGPLALLATAAIVITVNKMYGFDDD